jgi:hypothetical protein
VLSLFESYAAKNAVKKSTYSYVDFVPVAFRATRFPPRRHHPPSQSHQTSTTFILHHRLWAYNDGTKEEKAECVKEEIRALIVAVKEERRALVVAVKEERRALVVAVVF